VLTIIGKVDQTENIDYSSINIQQVAGDPVGKATFKVTDPGSQIALHCLDEVIIVDETVALTPSGTTPSPINEALTTNDLATNWTSTNNPSGSPASWTYHAGSGGTSLSLYGLTATSTTLITAAKLASSTGGSASSVTTTINAGSGYYELLGLGGVSTAVGSLPQPSGKGWLFDTTSLEGQTLASGNYTFIGKLAVGSGTLGPATLTLRVYKRSSSGTYTAITSGTTTSFTVTTTATAESSSVTGIASMSFATGDKLYVDAFLNAAPGSSRNISFSVSSTTSGVAQDLEVDTPGYGATNPANITASGGLSALLLYNTWLAQSVSLSATMTQSDFGGLAWNVVDTSDYYELAVRDASSPVPNSLQLYKTVNGVRAAIGPNNVAISFTRGTSHAVSVSAAFDGTNTSILVGFDGTQKISYVDTSPLGAGSVGLRNDTFSGASSSIYTAFSATSNDIPTLTTSVPAHNYLGNNNFTFGAQGWHDIGTLTGLFTYPAGTYPSGGVYGAGAVATLNFSNNAVGTALAAQTIINVGLAATNYAVPGQSYCLSAIVNITAPFTNASAELQIQFLDVAGNILSSATSEQITATTGSQRFSVQGTAPPGVVQINAAFGGVTTSATNSGTVTFTALQFEPMWFPNTYSYPSPICDFLQSDCITLPDGTACRMDRVFCGYISHLTVSYLGTTRIYDVEATGLDGLLENITLVNASYTSQTDQAIITGITNSLTQSGGIFAATPSLQSNTPQSLAYRNVPICYAGATISAIQFADNTLREVVDALTAITGFLAGIDNYYNVYYYPPFYNAAPYGFSDSPDNVTTFPYYDYSIEYDGSQIQSALRVLGATVSVQTIENWNAQDGSHSEATSSGKTVGFLLKHIPNTLPTTFKIGGSSLSIGEDTSVGFGGASAICNLGTSNNSYFGPGSVSLLTAISSGTSISVTYTYNEDIYVEVRSPDSIAQYGRPLYSKINDSNLTSTAAAVAAGEAQAQSYELPRVTVKFKTQKLLLPGQVIELTSAQDGLTKAHYAVQQVTVTDLGNGVNEYDVQAGTYIDDFIDFFRNTQKAINRVDHNPADPVLQTSLTMIDSVSFTDSLNIHT
jgi:hypothetical protein